MTELSMTEPATTVTTELARTELAAMELARQRHASPVAPAWKVQGGPAETL